MTEEDQEKIIGAAVVERKKERDRLNCLEMKARECCKALKHAAGVLERGQFVEIYYPALSEVQHLLQQISASKSTIEDLNSRLESYETSSSREHDGYPTD